MLLQLVKLKQQIGLQFIIFYVTRKDFIDVLEILKNKMNKKIVLEMIANLVEIFVL